MIIGSHRVFFSTLTYELGRQLGIEGAAAEFLRQCERPTRASLPVARMVARLREIADVQLYHGASTNLPKARSRAAHEALISGADYWLMCDDDVECDSRALGAMFDCAGAGDLAAAVLPCLMRGTAKESETVTIEWDSSIVVQAGAGMWRAVRRGGTSMMLVTRIALGHVVTEAARQLPLWIDDDGREKVPLFALQHGPDGQWWGEDYSFCERLHEACVDMRAPLWGVSMHAGNALRLDSLR